MDIQYPQLILSIVTLLTLLINSVRIYFSEKQKMERESLERQWDREDRISRNEKVLSRIAENTEVSVKAFNEANNVNEKLLRVHEDVKSAVKNIPPPSVTNVNVTPAPTVESK